MQSGHGVNHVHTAEYGVSDKDSLVHIADSLREAVSTAYGGRLSEGQLDEVRTEILNQLAVAQRLHRYRLTNGDEPAFGFAAYDGER